jgi:hypothetical protein
MLDLKCQIYAIKRTEEKSKNRCRNDLNKSNMSKCEERRQEQTESVDQGLKNWPRTLNASKNGKGQQVRQKREVEIESMKAVS